MGPMSPGPAGGFSIHLAGIARDRGCGRLEWQVLDRNEPGIGFHRSRGAVPMSDRTMMRVTGGAPTRLADGTRGGAGGTGVVG